MATRDYRFQAAQKAIDSIGLGFDITQDIDFDNCKWGSRLVQVSEEQCRHLEIPGRVSIPNVPNSIKYVTGESLRIHSDILTLNQMTEHFNMGMRLAGKIPSGHFCASFGLMGHSWQDMVANTVSLAYDGWFIKRYSIELELDKFHVELLDHVKEAVPSSWDPEALARFIGRFGTHVIVGVSMGGKDVLYARQGNQSNLQPSNLQQLLKDTASMRFMDSATSHCLASEDLGNKKENLVVIYNRRGGSSEKMNHREWLDTIDFRPDIISMFLLPVGSLLSGINGGGYMVHALNLYARYKPPIEDLQQFLEFQLPRLWAPTFGDKSLVPHRKHQEDAWLRFHIFGPKLYINTIPVDAGNRPVVGLRLYLEGRKTNRLAIRLQHLESLPKSFPLSDNVLSYDSYSCNFLKKLKWNSYICTAPVESDDNISIVTGAQLIVEKRCLLLRLRFSKVIGATLKKPPEWDQPLKSGPMGFISSLISSNFKEEEKNHPKPGQVTIGSSVYTCGPPLPVQTPELQRFVDTTEIIRGPEHSPGHWIVSGARLCVQNRKIYLSVKYSLLSSVN